MTNTTPETSTAPETDLDGMILIRSRDEIPTHFENSDEEARWWETHELTEEAMPMDTPLARARLQQTRAVLGLPPTRAETGTTAINVRLETDVLERLRKLANARGLGYQTLLKRFIVERLYEEEHHS